MKGKSVDSLFVTNQANEWIGLVTLQDVQEHDGDKARTVEDIMQTDIETLDADDVVTDAAKIFQRSEERRVGKESRTRWGRARERTRTEERAGAGRDGG